MITVVVFGKDVFNRCVNLERHSRTQPVVVHPRHERTLVVGLGLALDQRGDRDHLRDGETESRAPLPAASGGSSRKN